MAVSAKCQRVSFVRMANKSASKSVELFFRIVEISRVTRCRASCLGVCPLAAKTGLVAKYATFVVVILCQIASKRLSEQNGTGVGVRPFEALRTAYTGFLTPRT